MFRSPTITCTNNVHFTLRTTPDPKRCGVDWMAGLPRVFRGSFPGGSATPGVEHMLRNLRKSKVAGEAKRIPQLQNRPDTILPRYLHAMALLPTRTMFALALSTFLTRAMVVWLEEKWVQYFKDTYLKIQEPGIWTARWWYGMSSWHEAGIPPSQQVPEQCHKKLKRTLSNDPS